MLIEQDLEKIIKKVSKNEILKLRNSYKENNTIENYIFEISEKIFKKWVFPYLRFEILLGITRDIVNN